MPATAFLAIINFFIGDIQGGLGPFLATWLAQTQRWSPYWVGLVTTIVGLATLALNAPAGALVDRGRPRLLLGLACFAILAGTLLLLKSRAFVAVLAAQFVAAAGGTLVMPAVTALTLGVVGKKAFPRQQGRNQAFNHAGIVVAALVIAAGSAFLGTGAAFLVLSTMAVGAIVAVAVMPAKAWNARRAVGWKEDSDDTPKGTLLAVLGSRRLLLLAGALALFNLGNGAMLSLIGQRLVVTSQHATEWTAAFVVIAQCTMIPVALWAGSLADKRGRRRLLLIACVALIARGSLSALVNAPVWLIPAEILDGLGSGLIGVAVPVLVADLTWGSGRTQTALGTINGLQGVGGALSGTAGGLLVHGLGWSGAFLALAAPGVLALALALLLEETREA